MIEFPYKITPPEEEIDRNDYVYVGEQKWCLRTNYAKEASLYYNFEVRPDDVFVVSCPRSGTTLTQEMVWLLTNDLNYEKAREIPLIDRFPFLEVSIVKLDEDCLIEKLNKSTERRFIKSHLPLSLLPPNLLECGCKVIYVARNPKDVIISRYHFQRLTTHLYPAIAKFSEYYKRFSEGRERFGPYFAHVKEAWTKRNNSNLYFFFYEDLMKDKITELEKLSRFLGKKYTRNELEALKDHLDINKFRKNPSVNISLFNHIKDIATGEEGFIRKGETGNWEDYFDEDLNKQANKWIEDNLQDTDLRYPHVSF